MGIPKVVVLMTQGAEECEFTIVMDVLRRVPSQVEVCSASLDGPDAVKMSKGIKIFPDVAFDDIKNTEYDAVVIPGGAEAATRFSASEELGKFLKSHEKKDKYITAVCSGPIVVKAHGIGKGKSITSYPTEKDKVMKDNEYKYVEENTVVDGKLITSRSPGTTFEFVLTIVEHLLGKSTKDALAKELLYCIS